MINMLGIYCRTSVEKSVAGVATIIQQEEAGIKFADSMGWQYKIYKDEGKSGYKVEDEDNPFIDRAGFQQLLEDIKSKVVTDVWVIENSRLSRNSTTQAIIYRLFEKNKITIYENGRKYDLNNPTDKLTKQILDAVAEFERYEIVFRTNRGFKNAVDSGKWRYRAFFGYEQINGETKPEMDKLEKVKNAYKMYLDGKSLNSIGSYVFPDNDTKASVSRKARTILTHYDYTSFTLTTSGREILKNYEDGNIPDLHELLDLKYWVKSKWYTVEVVSIEDWIKVKESINRKRKEKAAGLIEGREVRETDRSLCSGMYECRYCHTTFYFHFKVLEKADYYRVYRHWKLAERCTQDPRSIPADTLEAITDIYAFLTLIFISRPEINKQIIENSKIQIAEINKAIEEINAKIDKAYAIRAKFEDNLVEEEDKNSQKFIIQALTKKNTEIEKLEAEKNNKLEERNKIQKDIDILADTKTPIEKLRYYFNLRNNADFKGARIFLADNVFNPLNAPVAYKPSIYKNEVQLYRYHFDFTRQYNVVYPFIEKVLGIKLNYVNYNAIEENWVNNNQELLNQFADGVTEYCNNRTTEKEDELLSLIFNVKKNFTFTTLEALDIYSFYKTCYELADELKRTPLNINKWAKLHNVLQCERPNSKIKSFYFTPEDVEKYKSRMKK